MIIRKAFIIILFVFSMGFTSGYLQAQPLIKTASKKDQILQHQISDSLKWSVHFLNKLLYSDSEWYFTDQLYKKPIRGVLNYAENDPLDTIIVDVKRLLNDDKVVLLIDRRPQDIRNIKEIHGYISEEEIEKGVETIRKKVLDSLNISSIIVPMVIMDNELTKAPYVPDGDPDILWRINQKTLPQEFVLNLSKRFTSIPLPLDRRGAAVDSIHNLLFNTYRTIYNDSVMNSWRERVIFTYRSKFISELTDLKIKAFKKSVEAQNFNLLSSYNDNVVKSINDSLKTALKCLTNYAEKDSTLIRLTNLKNEKTELWTANRSMKPIRMFLKNAQDDSLSVVLISNGKGEIKLVIDDGIKLTRFVETQNRSVKLATKSPDGRLKKVTLNKIVYPPWTLIGNGTVGFTQTSLSNWAKGGESALALLIMSKYNANYSKDKVKWENGAEFRYGISRTKSRGLEKNDDKIELQSRFGYSAFKKWYYSAETNFRTQIARGYNFPEKQKAISAFMAPGYLTISVGLDYKPNKNFSLFLAPFTSKTTYVTDTIAVNPSTYGLEPGKKKLWEPGMIVKANWHVNLAENITYDTKGEFFNNYRYSFQKFAFEWEQMLIIQVNRSFNVRVMTQLIYDYNTKFPILDNNGVEIGRKPKWQFKELFTIGFVYKF